MLVRHPRAPFYRRRGDQQELASIQGYVGEEPLQPRSGLFRTSALEQVVGSKHDDQQICISRKVRGRRGNLPAVLPQVADGPAGFLGQDIHPPAVHVIAAAQIGARIVAVGVRIAETDDVHFAAFPSLIICASLRYPDSKQFCHRNCRRAYLGAFFLYNSASII